MPLGRLGLAANALEAFLDESGTNPETPVLSVAGCYAQHNQWLDFKRLWEPHSGTFHAKDGDGKFGKLVECFIEAKINSMLVTVSKEKYKRYANAHLKTAIGNPYAACTLLCAATICGNVLPRPVAFVLESGQPNLTFVKQLLEQMMGAGYPDWRISAVASARKEEFIELQCADFVSHISSSYDKRWMGKLFEHKILQHAHLTQDNLEYISYVSTQVFRQAKAMRKAIERNK